MVPIQEVGPAARRLFGIDVSMRFYDVQGLLHHPKLLNAMCAVMARRFRKMKVTKVCGFEVGVLSSLFAAF